MNDVFSKADTLFAKIAADETGRLRKLVNQIIQSTKAATDLGCTPRRVTNAIYYRANCIKGA